MFIVVTGLDGSGKTTLVNDLAEHLDARCFHLPHHKEVLSMLNISGNGEQFSDTWTDRLIFALDNRLANYKISSMLENGETVISQRGWMDSFIHGAVQGYSYQTSLDLTKAQELTKPDATVYLTCDPETAWSRIKDDPKKDKFETHDYLVRQHEETALFYDAAGVDDLEMFNEPRILIDTTNKSHVQIRDETLEWLKANLLDS